MNMHGGSAMQMAGSFWFLLLRSCLVACEAMSEGPWLPVHHRIHNVRIDVQRNRGTGMTQTLRDSVYPGLHRHAGLSDRQIFGLDC
jgi:hypothetical protein